MLLKSSSSNLSSGQLNIYQTMLCQTFPETFLRGRDTGEDYFLFNISTSVLDPKTCLNIICSCIFPKEIYYEETHSKSTSTKGGLNKYQEEPKRPKRDGGHNCPRKRGIYNYCNCALILGLESLRSEFHFSNSVAPFQV